MKDRLFLMDILRLVFLKMGGVVEKMVGMMGGIEMVHKCLLPCCSGVL
jgi:hypothetical protein